jgi:hypothetical protein
MDCLCRINGLLMQKSLLLLSLQVLPKQYTRSAVRRAGTALESTELFAWFLEF